MNKTEREILLDILSDEGYTITLNEDKAIKAQASGKKINIFVLARSIELVIYNTLKNEVTPANKLSFDQALELVMSI